MPRLSINIPHELPKEEALKRIKGMLEALKSEHADLITDLKEEWNADTGKFSFTAKGFDLSGLINVKADNVDIDAKVPLAVSLFSGKIKSIITDKAGGLLAK